ncbi:MAG TPA: cobyric acid synthase [Sporosarcina sp.]|nr:cobyric acid synthase [Sporosarcina sp.]
MKGIILLGTASDVGKSMITTAFCRLFANEGRRVTPFKSQNLSPFIEKLPSGGAISRAQYIQALAAKTTPTMDMNPIMLLPQQQMRVDVTILGEPFGTWKGFDFREQFYNRAIETIHTSLRKLAETNDIVVIEGAGSPAEVNLNDREIVNMRVAEIADVPAILIADISKGGAIAAIVGTLQLLPASQRKRVKGIIINQFYGDVTRFQEGIEVIETHTNIPVLGVIPHMENHGIAEEDQLRTSAEVEATNAVFDAWAMHVKEHLAWGKVQKIVEGGA